MDAKTIIAVVLSVGVILAYTLIFAPKDEMVPAQGQGQQQSVFDRRPEQRSQNDPLHLSPILAVPNCGAVESELEIIQNDLIKRDTEVFEIHDQMLSVYENAYALQDLTSLEQCIPCSYT